MIARSDELREIFDQKYVEATSDWGGGGSGPGSEPFYNIQYRAFLENFLVQNHIGYVDDIGCGDWSFSRYIRFHGLTYRGFDVAPSIITQNIARFSAPNITFEVMPEDKCHVPGADLLLMKDVLQHLSDDEIYDFHERVFPKYRFCLITNSYKKMNEQQNVNIQNGAFRCLDLLAAPYLFRGAYVLQFNTGVWEEVRTLLIIR